MMKIYILVFLIASCALSQSCRKKGCKNVTAINYDPEVKKDDGTCIFPENNTPLIMQNKLIGTWNGTGIATFSGGIECTSTFTIESDGHYSAHVTSVQAGDITSVFNNGDDNLDHPDKKFTMQSIDAFGKANGKVTFLHYSGSWLEYEIHDMVFSNGCENVDFVVSWGAEISYSLIRE